MSIRALLSYVRDVIRMGKIRAELREEQSTSRHLRRALERKLSEGRVDEVVLNGYRRATEQLSTAVYGIAMPALRECDSKCGGENRRSVELEEALPEYLDEDEVRASAWAAEEWIGG